MENYNYSSGAMPAGFGLALAANQKALDGYTRMTEAEKEQILMKCKEAKSDFEMERIINSLGLNDNEAAEVLDDLKADEDGGLGKRWGS